MKLVFVLSFLLLTATGFSASREAGDQKPAAAKSSIEAWKLGLIGLAIASFIIRKRL